MKRKTKNVVMLFILALLCGLMFLTMNYAKTNITSNGNQFNVNRTTPPDMPNGSDFTNNVDGTNTPPEKPDGDSSAQNEMPNNNQGGTPPDMSNNSSNSNSLSYVYYMIFGTLSLIFSYLLVYLLMSRFNKKSFKETYASGDKMIISILSIIILTGGLTYIDTMLMNKYFLSNSGTANNNQPGNQSNALISYSASKEITEDTTIDSGNFTSSKSDENSILISGDIKTTISNINVTKTGDSDGGDNTSFYGINSAIIAKGGANLILKNVNVETNATGANGVFSYGGSATTNNSSSDGTTITISDSTITTTKDNSGGIMTTGGGIMKASNLTINTSGTSSAAIRTDRGGGTVSVDGGTYTTTVQGSPTIYSTANVSVNNAKLIAKASEGIVIEGKNKVSITNCSLTDSNTKLNGQSTTYKNIFLYQSMSGDADTGTSEFNSTDSTITTNNGDSFYITNTIAVINLENNTIINNDTDGNFLRAQKDSWGTSESNGGDVTLNMTKQKVTGNIVIDSISTLSMTMKTNSYYEGVINGDNSAKSIKITLDKTSKIKLTGNSYITSLDNADSSNSNIDFNGYKLYVNGTAIN